MFRSAWRERKSFWLALVALTLAGLILRLLAARGALWLDEAWSASFAQHAGTPIAVIFKINHDNNHILNTLWLLFVGPDAAPILQRGLSIACGTAMIPVAAAIGKRRSTGAALIAALAVAISPMMVTYGAEARGYAPMLLATLTALLWVDRQLAGIGKPEAARLGLATLLGTLAQLLMVASLGALVAWFALTLRRKNDFPATLRRTLATLGPAMLCAAAVIAVMILAARMAPNGFAVGDYQPFTFGTWDSALGSMICWALGLGALHVGGLPPIVAAAIAATLIARRRDQRTLFYAIAILAFPLAFPALQIGNAGVPRYYLLSALGLLLLLADIAGDAIVARGWQRPMALAAVTLFVIGSAIMDAGIIQNLRGNPGAAIDAVRARAPSGTTIAVSNGRMDPVVDFAARAAGYPVTEVTTPCGPASFLWLDGNQETPDLIRVDRCGQPYRQIARGRVYGLSGTWWWLYERDR